MVPLFFAHTNLYICKLRNPCQNTIPFVIFSPSSKLDHSQVSGYGLWNSWFERQKPGVSWGPGVLVPLSVDLPVPPTQGACLR